VGNGFQMYAQENKMYLPVAVHQNQPGRFPLNAATTPGNEIRWPDQISRYVSKEVAYNQIHTVRQSSVLWGCPEWNNAMEGSDATPQDRLFTGVCDEHLHGAPGWELLYSCLPRDGSVLQGDRVEQANGAGPRRRQPLSHLQATPSGISLSGGSKFAPLDASQGETGSNQLHYFGDGRRHGPAEANRRKQYDSKYMNMLFIDGHATSVSVREAYNATRFPGQQKALD
jgi:prepilin-type processing-associated H-X9-DG protein